MKKNVSVFFAIALFCATTYANAIPPLRLSSAYVLPGIYASYNIRDGYRKFDGANEYLYVQNENLFMIGGVLGKRFALNSRLRLQAFAEGGWGTANDNIDVEIVNGYGDLMLTELHSAYWTGGILTEAHLLFPVGSRTYFLSCGPGLHLTRFNPWLKTQDGQKITKLFDQNGTKTWGSELYAFSPSINVGAGVEYQINNKRAVALCYNFRFWQSAHYIEVGGLFPIGVEYQEFFYSHAVYLQILLPGLSFDKRFER